METNRAGLKRRGMGNGNIEIGIELQKRDCTGV